MAQEDVPSRINIVSRVRDSETERILDRSAESELARPRQSRSVGDVRVSIYNTVPVRSIQKLESYMEDFAQCKW